MDVDSHGHSIDRTALPQLGTSGLRVRIELQPPLLYWADRRQWMWHKKCARARVLTCLSAPAHAITHEHCD